MKHYIWVIVLILNTEIIISQHNCIDNVKLVYNDIVESIGYNFPPKLVFSNSKNKVAYYNGREIVIEKKIISYLCGKENFKAKISYILSHELAHNYFKHTWMYNSGLAYASESREFLDNKSYEKDQRKIAEIQADIFGGFFGQISGYNTLSYAADVLVDVYKLYEIPDKIEGYPSLNERIQIVNSRIDLATKLVKLFDIANVCLLYGEYQIANELYNDILLNEFRSREIYNNIGLTYLLRIINIDNRFNKYLFPISLEQNTRSQVKMSRNQINDIELKDLFLLAKKNFDLANQLDKNYFKSIQNKLVLDFLKDLNIKTLKKIKSSSISDELKVDFEILFDLITKNKTRKNKKKGSSISKINLNEVYVDYSEKYDSILDELGIEPAIIFGFKNLSNSKKIKTPSGNIVIEEGKYNDYKIYKSRNWFLIETNLKLENYSNYKSVHYKNKYYYFISLD